jgi:hypothetical protein
MWYCCEYLEQSKGIQSIIHGGLMLLFVLLKGYLRKLTRGLFRESYPGGGG